MKKEMKKKKIREKLVLNFMQEEEGLGSARIKGTRKKGSS